MARPAAGGIGVYCPPISLTTTPSHRTICVRLSSPHGLLPGFGLHLHSPKSHRKMLSLRQTTQNTWLLCSKSPSHLTKDKAYSRLLAVLSQLSHRAPLALILQVSLSSASGHQTPCPSKSHVFFPPCSLFSKSLSLPCFLLSVCSWVEVWDQLWVSFLWSHPPCFFEACSLSGTWKFTIRLGWLASEMEELRAWPIVSASSLELRTLAP